MAKVGVQEDNILLCGRWFTEQELEDVKYIVRMFPNLSRHELANTICEGLSWVLPNGNYKIESCYQLLEKLEKQSEIVLPQNESIFLRRTQNQTRTAYQAEARHKGQRIRHSAH